MRGDDDRRAGKVLKGEVKRTRGSKMAAQKSFPRWLVGVGSAVAVLVGYVGTRGGLEHAWKEAREALGYVSAPQIVSLQPRQDNSRLFVVGIRNRSLRTIEITSFGVEPVIDRPALASEIVPGALPVLKAEHPKPAPCEEPHLFAIVTPLVIGPESSAGLEVMPWRDECEFSIQVIGTTGMSEPAYWPVPLARRIELLRRENPQMYALMMDQRSKLWGPK